MPYLILGKYQTNYIHITPYFMSTLILHFQLRPTQTQHLAQAQPPITTISKAVPSSAPEVSSLTDIRELPSQTLKHLKPQGDCPWKQLQMYLLTCVEVYRTAAIILTVAWLMHIEHCWAHSSVFLCGCTHYYSIRSCETGKSFIINKGFSYLIYHIQDALSSSSLSFI